MSMFDTAAPDLASLFDASLGNYAAGVGFDVFGTPVPQGSKKAYVANGRARMKESGGDKHSAWRNLVSEKAAEIRKETGTYFGPLVLVVKFSFAMPASAKAVDRRRGWAWKITAPDTDKLIRSIGDSLTAANLIGDDAQFVEIRAMKITTTGPTGVYIHIKPKEYQS